MADPVQNPPKFHALLIGVNCYPPGAAAGGVVYRSLNGCVRDIEHVEGFLRGTLKVPAEQIKKLSSTSADDPAIKTPIEPPEALPSYENIVEAFKELTKRAGKRDQVYIHYSGHGGRAKTKYPERKGGPNGLDEALVPYNIHDPKGQYVRDLEIAELLQALVAKGPYVTLVLDCCHSGGATRGVVNGVGVRGGDSIDMSDRPTPSRVTVSPGLTTRGLSKAEGLLPDQKGYTLLAACRPSELAREYPFDGKESNGALTYWFLDALQMLSPETTYKGVHERLLAKIHSQFDQQTPMLEGEPDRVVFGTKDVPSPFAALVMEVDAQQGRVVLGTGQAVGARKGTQFAIYDQASADRTSVAGRKAVVEIDKLGATESSATLVEPETMPNPPIQQGDHAVQLGAGSIDLIRRVRVVNPDGTPPAAENAALKAVVDALRADTSGWVELVDEAPAAFHVTTTQAGDAYEICDLDIAPIKNLRPAVRVDEADAAKTVVARLVHLAKYRAVQDLDNFNLEGSLRGKLAVSLVGVQDNYTDGDKIDPRPLPVTAGQILTLEHGQTTWLKIRNDSPTVLNVAVLDLEPNWAISQAYPTKEKGLLFAALDPGAELEPPHGIALVATLPHGYEEARETLKVVAAKGQPNFRVLELPELDDPPGARGATMRGEALSGLDVLLGQVAADQPQTRSMKVVSSPSEEWTVVPIEIQIVKKPKKKPV